MTREKVKARLAGCSIIWKVSGPAKNPVGTRFEHVWPGCETTPSTLSACPIPPIETCQIHSKRRKNEMSSPATTLPVDLPDSAIKRLFVTLGRSIRRHCPYCGGDGIFKDMFNLKERCPHCNTLFAYEDGYFLGAYAVNVVAMMFIGIALVFALIFGTDLSVLQMQIFGVIIAVALPVLFYPVSLLLWICIDLLVHPPGDFSGRPRQ